MGNKIRDCLGISAVVMIPLSALFLILTTVYFISTENTYRGIMLLLITVTLILLVLISIGSVLILGIYMKKRIPKVLMWIIRMELRFVMPIVIFVSSFLKLDLDTVRRTYIDINNIIVESNNISYKPEDVLLLVPHCLQYSECKFRITIDINNCKACGRCSIGRIKTLAEREGVVVKVVTGGTAAREVVKKYRPKIILSVACERDLSEGIADVRGIPVIGVLNKRPNGPCFNTTVDTDEFEERLAWILGEKGIKHEK